MANSANPEINKKIATSALGTLVIATVFFYLGDRYAETLVTYPGQIFDHLSDAFLSMWQTIKDAPFALDMTSNSLLFGGACFLIIWMIWLRYVAFIGNYRSGEESGSARWGTLKEGKKFKDLQTEDNNLLFTKNFGLALHRPKFDPEYDRNLNVLVVGGSGSGKTFNYVTPNICQLNTSYFVTDPKGTLLKDAGYLFTDNGYKLKSFNTINLDESMHYNPLKYVKTDTDILSFVNCFIMNTNPEGKSSGDPFWENAEKMLYTALIALLRDWFPAKDYNICEVEEGMFSSSIAFDDTSYHSVRDEQQKAMFSAITRLYDQFGADTLVQMSVINTPLLKEEVGHRKFFDPERQANDAARNDAQVFNNILNDKVKEGVSNIRTDAFVHSSKYCQWYPAHVLPSLRAWNIELCSYSSITELITTIVFLPFLAPAEYCVPDMTGYFLLCRYRFQKDAAVVGHRCDVINATQHVVLVPSVMNLMYDLCHRPIDQIRYIEKGAVGGKEGHGFRPFTVSGLLPLPVTLPRLRQC